MTPARVVVRLAPGLPRDFVPDVPDGSIVAVNDLEVLMDHPVHPVVALPSARVEQRGPACLRVYELVALGGAAR
ncbi:MAG TPA: hypothetical protein VFU35_04975 [Jatrophihabitans sp.]|nr:hypothetical protein [Jatrophihabitans sp.]